MRRLLAPCAFLVLCCVPRPVEARTYSADRFDSRIEVVHGGTLRVTETITLRFESGSYSQFFRMVPARLTDGIDILSASMDGIVLPVGDGVGHVQISGSERVRVTWRFAPTSNGTRTFELIYLVRGAVRQGPDADLFGWRILPSEHDYRIGSATADILLPDRALTPPGMEARRTGESVVSVDGTHVTVETHDIRRNGFVDVTARLPHGSVVDRQPAWQQRQVEMRRLAPTWFLAAGLVFFAGLALLFFVHQRYEPPPRDFSGAARLSLPPDDLPPALAGTLLTNGSPRLEHAMASMFSLADRQELTIDEQPRQFGQWVFAIKRTPKGGRLAPYEQQLFDIIFAGERDAASVTLGKARNRLVRHFKKFTSALEPAMVAAGLLDQDRREVRRRFGWIAALSGIAVGVSPLVLGFAFQRHGGWPFLITLALALVALVAVIAYAAHTPLSNDAVRRAAEWRAFRNYLRGVARDREVSPAEKALGRLLPFVVALGLGSSWSAYLKRHRTAAPTWFRAASDARANASTAFAAFVGSGGTGMSGHASHAAGGGIAGGGASGAS